MSSIFLIISALLPILTSSLQNAKVISPTVSGLITGIEGAASAVITALGAPGATSTPTVTVITLLTAISAGLQVLQTQSGITSPVLVIIAAVDSAIQAGLTAVNGITSVDPTKLQPITPA